MMPDSLERAQRIAETVLREQLNDVVFDQILVKPDNDRFCEDDGEYVSVKAIYEGRRERLRSERTLTASPNPQGEAPGRGRHRVPDPVPDNEVGMGPAS